MVRAIENNTVDSRSTLTLGQGFVLPMTSGAPAMAPVVGDDHYLTASGGPSHAIAQSLPDRGKPAPAPIPEFLPYRGKPAAVAETPLEREAKRAKEDAQRRAISEEAEIETARDLRRDANMKKVKKNWIDGCILEGKIKDCEKEWEGVDKWAGQDRFEDAQKNIEAAKKRAGDAADKRVREKYKQAQPPLRTTAPTRPGRWR